MGIGELPILERNGTLYYLAEGMIDADALWSVPLSGGSPTEIWQQDEIDAFCVDDTHLYFVSERDTGLTSKVASLWKVAITGGSPELVTENIKTDTLYDLVEHGDFLYTTESERSEPNDDDSPWIGRLVRISKSTGERTVSTVTEHGIQRIHADDTGIYFKHFAIEGEALMRADHE